MLRHVDGFPAPRHELATMNEEEDKDEDKDEKYHDEDDDEGEDENVGAVWRLD